MEASTLSKSIAKQAPETLRRIRPFLSNTPLSQHDGLSSFCKSPVRLKQEQLQVTGSFKIRGALSKVLSLPEDQRSRGLIAASTGNHALAVARACEVTGTSCTVALPKRVSPHKYAAIASMGATIIEHGTNGLEAELFARAYATEHKIPYVSPYNDIDVITGQATLGVELLNEMDETCSVYIAVGGGGLISGVAAVLRSRYPAIRIVGCSPANNPVMDESVRVGRIVEYGVPDTLSDGTAGNLESDTITFGLCQVLVNEWIRVSESEIAEALISMSRDNIFIEGAAGVAVAGLIKDAGSARSSRIAVLCGGNIDRDRLKELRERRD